MEDCTRRCLDHVARVFDRIVAAGRMGERERLDHEVSELDTERSSPPQVHDCRPRRVASPGERGQTVDDLAGTDEYRVSVGAEVVRD